MAVFKYLVILAVVLAAVVAELEQPEVEESNLVREPRSPRQRQQGRAASSESESESESEEDESSEESYESESSESESFEAHGRRGRILAPPTPRPNKLPNKGRSAHRQRGRIAGGSIIKAPSKAKGRAMGGHRQRGRLAVGTMLKPAKLVAAGTGRAFGGPAKQKGRLALAVIVPPKGSKGRSLHRGRSSKKRGRAASKKRGRSSKRQRGRANLKAATG